MKPHADDIQRIARGAGIVLRKVLEQRCVLNCCRSLLGCRVDFEQSDPRMRVRVVGSNAMMDFWRCILSLCNEIFCDIDVLFVEVLSVHLGKNRYSNPPTQ